MFAPTPPPPAPGAAGSAPAVGAGGATPAGPAAGGIAAPAAVGGRIPRVGVSGSGDAADAAEVTTPLYRVIFGTDGSATAWALRYRGDKPLVMGSGLGPLAVAVSRGGQGTEVVALRPEAARLEVTAERPVGTLSFSGVSSEGVRIRRLLRFAADSYRIEFELRAEGPSSGAGVGPLELALHWTSPVAQPGVSREAPWLTFGEGPGHRQLLGRILVAAEAGGVVAFDAPSPALRDPKETPGGPELKDPQLVPAALVGGERGWVALENEYFIAALIPAEGARLLRGREREVTAVGLVFSEVRPGPSGAWEGKGQLYVGPKEWDRLKAVGVGLEEAQARNYGHFLWVPWLPMWWFAVPLLWLMNFFGTHVPGQNYGVAIILLTVLVKALFYPLSQKSMSSMKQMQALQPQLNALRSKHRSDPQRFQREQMELFRRYRVNPMGGCLPMVVQIPIFYALYLTLQYSVELQGASFLLWISDLSKKDPYYVLPILMGVSMLVQQKMTPTVGDPRQAKVMLIMPVIFTFMFLEFPTGLVLYWLVNNVLSIAQQYLIERATQLAKPQAAAGRSEKEPRKA